MGKGSQKHRNKHNRRTPSGQPSRAKNPQHEWAAKIEADIAKADAAEGKKAPVRSDPSPFAEQRQELFCLFLGQQALGYEMTCVGRLRIVGAFDSLDVDPNAILAALQRYTLLYWGEFNETALKTADPANVGHGSRYHGRSAEILADHTGERFRQMDELLDDAGRDARLAVHSVTVDRHWFPDENAPWADRIINQRILDKRRQYERDGKKPPKALRIAGELATAHDWQMLGNLQRGALALALGRRKMAA